LALRWHRDRYFAPGALGTQSEVADKLEARLSSGKREGHEADLSKAATISATGHLGDLGWRDGSGKREKPPVWGGFRRGSAVVR